jgi:hypothetical protein
MGWRAMAAAALLVAMPNTMDRAAAQSKGEDAQESGWVELRCQKVGEGVGQDTILLAPGGGWFSALRVRVKRNDVVVRHLQVVFEDGGAQKFEIGHRIHADEASRQLDFDNPPRAIKRINLAYSPISDMEGYAQVCADGLAAPGGSDL